MLGSAGLILFRGTNRFSIVILTLSLLFLVAGIVKIVPRQSWQLSLHLFLWPVDSMGSNATADQDQAIAETEVVLRADKEFATTLENVLPKGSMVFQLPVMPFPESPQIVSMARL